MARQAVIFDLDGVITDTALYHYQSWKRIAEQLNIEFNPHDNEQLKGLDRLASLNQILSKGGLEKRDEEKQKLAFDKNRYYQSLIKTMSPSDILPGAIPLLADLRRLGVLTGLASSSKNAFQVLEQLKITHHFDSIADANLIQKNKPHPEIFLTVAKSLEVLPADCLGVEDSIAGIQAIKAAGMFAVGIGESKYLSQADIVFSSLEQLNYQILIDDRP